MDNLTLNSAYFTDFSNISVRLVNVKSEALAVKVVDECERELPLSSVDYISHGGMAAELKIALGCEIDAGMAYRVVCEPQSGAEPYFAYVKKHGLYDLPAFYERYAYDGALGVSYAAKKSTFSVWSPVASDIKLNIYADGDAIAKTEHDMTRGENGVWSAAVSGDLKGKYYTFSVLVDGKVSEVVDPYARSAGRNGKRGMILKPGSADPDGWKTQNEPKLENYCHAVIYEAHIRDLTMHYSSNVSESLRGKFLGLAEEGVPTNPTPLDRLKALGVTAVHVLPMFDFASVDEKFKKSTFDGYGEYNWGYDPLNYNVPEGSYSTDPDDGAVRVKELKKMIMALHNAGIQVIMDVVYNHVYDAGTSNFEALVPGYYFRTDANGGFFNGSGCGNETASERPMFRKFMIDSVKYWTEEYKIDGFRFDLMGLHDIDTMNAIYAALAAVNPDVIIYGEGWTGGASGLPEQLRATVSNAALMPNIAVFDDIVRDGLRGSVFDTSARGFVSAGGTPAPVYIAAAGGTNAAAPDVYGAIGRCAFAASPAQNVNYVACHDNSTLWDKLNASVNANADVLKAINRLAAVAVFTGQGICFMPAGEELLRSKPTVQNDRCDSRPAQYISAPGYWFSENSYKSPDSVNAVDWNKAAENADMLEFYKSLIAIKKTFPQFSIADTATLSECLFVHGADAGVAVYAVKDPASDEYAVVIINANAAAARVRVPAGSYDIFVSGKIATADRAAPIAVFSGDCMAVGERSAVVMTARLDKRAVKAWAADKNDADKAPDLSAALAAGITVPQRVRVSGGKVTAEGPIAGKK